MSRAVGMRSAREAASRDHDDLRPIGYLRKSQAPLTSLLFLLPLLILYEVGTHSFAKDARYLRAFDDMLAFFRLFGASGKYLPALAVAMILITWHIARKDPWEFDFGTAGYMILESIALSLPLFAMDALCKAYVPLRATHHAVQHMDPQWPAMIVLSIGAGIYEELVFRLGAFTLLSILFIDLLQIHRLWSLLLIVVGSAMLFASYHYQGGVEAFAWQTFVFRTGAGIYFGLLFFCRGFGITAGSHAAYDILAVLLPAFTTR